MTMNKTWTYNENGVYVPSKNGPYRTIGEPTTCRSILASFREEIEAASKRFDVPAVLLIMTIATEAAAFKKHGFTGPKTFRWEPRVVVNDMKTVYMGDYSAGPMQVLASTARWATRNQHLEWGGYDAYHMFPPIAKQPDKAPDFLPIYEPETAITIGAAVIKQRWKLTGDDPILVAAAYNAGGIYKGIKQLSTVPRGKRPTPFCIQFDDGSWWTPKCHLPYVVSQPSHIERAAQWYGDACAVLKE